MDVISSWALEEDVQAVITNGGSNIVKEISLLRKELEERFPGDYIDEYEFHVQCLVHIISLSVKDSMLEVHTKINKIQNQLNAVR